MFRDLTLEEQQALARNHAELYLEPCYVDRCGRSFEKIAHQSGPVVFMSHLPAHTFGRRKGHGLWPNSRMNA